MKIKNLTEGLDSQQRSVPELPAMFRPAKINVLTNKTDPRHPMTGYAVGASESADADRKRLGPNKNDPWEQGWRANPAHAENPYQPGTREHAQWADGQAERRAQPRHYDEGRAGVDDTDTVGFSVNSEAAYTAVMKRFGDVIDHDETSGIMYAPAGVWPRIEMTAFDADGEGAVRDDGIDESGVAEQFNPAISMMWMDQVNQLAQAVSQLSPEELVKLNDAFQNFYKVAGGTVAGGAAASIGGMFYSLMKDTLYAAKRKARIDTEEILQLQRQIVSIHKRLKTLKSEPAIAKYQEMLKQAYEVLEELEARQDNKVAEGERNEMDTPAVQAALARMAERHKGEKWTKEQLAALGKRIAARGQKPVKEGDVEDFLARGGKITQVKPNRGPRHPGLSLGSKHIGGGGDGARASRTGRGSKPQGKPVVAVESITKEDIISKLKARLGDYLSDISKEIKKDPDLVDKLSAKAPGDQMGPPVKTVTTDDGHEIQIHGNEDDGFRVSIKNRPANAKFKNLDEAVMACEMYCARRRAQTESADYIDEADKDACYNKVKSRYKIWPSAYASGALVKCRKVGAANWGNKSKK
jgi:hypothetical protein